MLNSAGADPQLRVRRPFACGFVLKLVLRIPWRSSHVDKEMDVKEMDVKEMDVDKANAMSPCEHLLEVRHECCPTLNWPLRLSRRFRETRRSIAHDIAARLSALPLDPAVSVAADSGRVSHSTMTLFSHPQTPKRNRTSRGLPLACVQSRFWPLISPDLESQLAGK